MFSIIIIRWIIAVPVCCDTYFSTNQKVTDLFLVYNKPGPWEA